MKYANITGWGKCLPPAVLTNDALSTIMDTSDEWIYPRTGIKARRVSHVSTQALATLHFAPQAAAEPVRKVIESAVANAETSEGLHNEQLVISQIYVDEGVTMRRIRPRAKGSASRILKRASHITAVVEPAETAGHPPLKKASSAKNSSKATAADTTSDDTKEA